MLSKLTIPPSGFAIIFPHMLLNGQSTDPHII